MNTNRAEYEARSYDQCEPWENEDNLTDAAILALARRAVESQATWEALLQAPGAGDPVGIKPAGSVATQAEYDFADRVIARYGRSPASILADLVHDGRLSLADIRSLPRCAL